MMNMRYLILFGTFGLCNLAAADTVQMMLDEYRQQGATDVKAQSAERLWTTEHTPGKGGQLRSCATCHGDDPRQPGKHVRTGKVIAPMAVSVNSKRFSDVKKIRKWFKRNCKWTLGRECSAQEQADILVWLNSQ